jgi:hypothetical protein
VVIEFPLQFQEKAILRDGKLQEIGSHDAATGTWAIDLPPGAYEVRPATQQDGTGWTDKGLFRVLGEDRRVSL